MALNLNKSENGTTTNSGTKKKSYNLDKTPSGTSRGFNLENKQIETIHEPSISNDENPNTPNRRPWALIAIVALIIIGGLFWFMNKDSQDNSKVNVTEKSSLEPASENSTNDNSDNIPEAGDQQSTAVEPDLNIDSKTGDKMDVVSSESTTNNTTTAESANLLNEDDIEAKAKKVIMGNFGNGINRKNALGGEYEAIQARVNELYKNGL